MNYQVILQTEREYHGEPLKQKGIEKFSRLRKLKPKENTYEYFDQYNKPSVIKDKDGNIVGYIEW